MDKLGINPLLLFAQIVNFVLLYVLLKRFLYKPILKMLDERTQKVEEQLQLSEDIKKEREATEVEKKKVLAESREKGKGFEAEARKEAQVMKDEILRAAKKEAERIVEQKMKEVERMRIENEKQLKQKTAELAVLVARQVVEENLDHTSQKKLVETAITHLEKIAH